MACSARYYRVAKAILAVDADCEDAMQEAMVKAWTGLTRLRNEDHFETWLCRILINECRMMLRRRARAPVVQLPETLSTPEPPNQGLWDALQSLDMRYRIPLILHHADGYTLEETARILRLPVSTVKWRIRRGKEALLTRLKEGDES